MGEAKKPLIETISKAEQDNLVAFFTDMKNNPDFQNYQTFLYERSLVVQESVMMSEADRPYQRGYSVGCLHSATFAEDYPEQVALQRKQEEEDKAEEAEHNPGTPSADEQATE